jgi:hypothetical protein
MTSAVPWLMSSRCRLGVHAAIFQALEAAEGKFSKAWKRGEGA